MRFIRITLFKLFALLMRSLILFAKLFALLPDKSVQAMRLLILFAN